MSHTNIGPVNKRWSDVGGGGGGGVSTFLALTDTPGSFSSQALKAARVNAGETAVEFVDQDHDDLANKGSNTHAQIDTHIADATLHYTEAAIDHANILNIGSNSHAAIDAHVADATKHFTEGSIDHTAIANIGSNSHATIDSHLASTSNPHSVTAAQAGAEPSGAVSTHEGLSDPHTGYLLADGTRAMTGALQTDDIDEATSEEGVTVDGARIKDGGMFQRRHIITTPDPASTSTIYTVGGAPLSVGSPTTPLSINSRARPYRRNTNNITVGSGILETGFTSTQREWDPYYENVLWTGSDITHVRYWSGLFSASPNNVNSPSALHFAAFRYITSVDGTAFWRAVTSDGATANVTTTTAAIAALTEYKLRIECELAVPEVRFYVDDVLVATHTANLPALDTMLGHGLWFQPLATGGSRFFEWSYVDLCHN